MIFNKEELVTFEQAVKLKELGFKEQCFNMYCNGQADRLVQFFCYTNVKREPSVAAPLLSQVAKWLLKEHNILCIVDYSAICSWYCEVYANATVIRKRKRVGLATKHSSYEQALSAGIDSALGML